ncbi:MAG: DNA recombination protein RmuC [Candidatus Roizmanbacteria bacterium]|nr:DNA recombination protein RmuC [Candidatus Roizmanbacteria bacterium]
MDLTILIGIVLIIGLIFLFFFLKQLQDNLNDSRKRQDELTQLMSQSVSEQHRTFIDALQKNSSEMGERLDRASQVIGTVQKSIGEFSEIGRSMKDLQDYISSPKLRGNMGEHILGETLKQMLPSDFFVLQYPFPNGEIVDALIKLQEDSIPIDAKFPMANFKEMHRTTVEKEKKEFEKLFKRDVIKHISDIARKYIRTDQGTIDYAIMYIPSEAVFYEAIMHDAIQEAAREKRVVMVSPSTFHAFLRAVLMSLQGVRIQKEAKEILAIIHSSKQEYEKIADSLSTLDKHLSNAYNQLQQVNKFFVQLGQRLTRAQSISIEAEKETKKIA